MQEPAGESSESIDVAFSNPRLPSDGTPVPAAELDSQPVSSGGVVATAVGEPTGRSKKITEAARDALRDTIGDGVTMLGSGLGTIGEGVSKLGERSRKVPLVGTSVTKLGESITTVGESLSELPRVARTRRGKLLVRSVVVGFLLVFAWIAVIVALQVRGIDSPDFRPDAEKILIELSQGSAAIEDVYEKASPRFQEMVRKERFIDDMTDMVATVGKFKEIAAINDTLVSSGPTGRVGRVSMTVLYEKGKARTSVSLHSHQGAWKLLGIGVEVPPELEITQAQREQRVQACKDPMDAKGCDLYVAANHILEQLRDGQADQVWDAATRVFQKQEEKSKFVAIQAEHAATLGAYRRIIAVTEAKIFSGGTSGTFDILLEYARSQGVRAIFTFYRQSKSHPWKLRSFKLVLPMPRADEPAGGSEPPPAHAGSSAPSR